MKTRVCEVKNALDRNNNKLGTAEAKISKLEDSNINYPKKHREKIILKRNRTLVSYGDIIQWPNTWVIEIPRGGK